jgi:hypothetical protein
MMGGGARRIKINHRENYTLNRDMVSIDFPFSNETLMDGRGYTI